MTALEVTGLKQIKRLIRNVVCQAYFKLVKSNVA